MSNDPWGAPPPAAAPVHPRAGNGGLIAGLSLALALLLAITIGTVSWLSPEPTVAAAGGATTAPNATPTGKAAQAPTAAPPSTQPSVQPSAGPSRVAPRPNPRRTPQPRQPDMSLRTNSLYAIDLSGGTTCRAKVRRPKPPVKNSALAPYLRTIITCLVDAFRAPLAKQGFALTTPKIRTFKGSVTTPCGKLGSKTNPAFYCAGTIYWPVTSDDAREAYTFARLGYLGLTAHEFGHHLQATTGMLSDFGSRYAAEDRSGRYALSRRLELQAQCFEGVFLAQVSRSIKLSARDRTELREWHSFTGDEDPPSSRKPDHGTSKAQYAWLEKGLAGADFGRCNTWSAPSKSVK